MFSDPTLVEELSAGATFASPKSSIHNDEGFAVLLPDFVNRADIRMIRRQGSFRFAPKTRQCLGIFSDFIGQEFHRYKAMQGQILGLIDDAHATVAKLLDNAVMRDRSTDYETESAP